MELQAPSSPKSRSFSQDRIAYWIALGMTPFFILTTGVVLYSFAMPRLLIISAPPYLIGTYIYFGYWKIARRKVTDSRAQRIWQFSMGYNAALALIASIYFFQDGINYLGQLWPIALQVAMFSLSWWAMNRPLFSAEYQKLITEIGR